MLVEGNEMPIITTDHPEVLQFDVASFSGAETVGRVRGYYITVRAVGPGEANLICSYHGELAYVLPLKVKAKS